MLVTLLVWATQVLGLFSAWDERAIDKASQLSRPDPLALPLCVVELSDDAVRELGNPPSREAYARLLDVLARGGARWVVLDLVFDLPRAPAEDSALARALRRHPNTTLAGQLPERVIESSVGGEMQVLAGKEQVRPLDAFLTANPRWGVVLNREDADGVVRRYRAAWRDLAGQSRLALGPRALADMGWLDTAMLESAPWNDPRGFRIRYAGGPRSFPFVSLEKAADDSSWISPTEEAWGERLNLADSLTDAGVFRDKIVLVGATARTLQDIYKIPGGSAASMSGVELHAHAIATLLSRRSVADPPRWFIWPALFLSCWALLRYLRRLMTGLSAVLLFVGLLCGWVVAVTVSVAWLDTALQLSDGMVLLAGTMLMAAVERMLLEAARKREITRAFGQYVSPAVVRLMIADPNRVVLGGSRAEITVLFSDFEDFTGLSEGMPPEELVRVLGESFTGLSQVLLDEGGTLDKFMGDGILAEFGMPFPQEDKALRACRAAWKMQERLGELHRSGSIPRLRMRIGLSTGEAIFGNLGSRQKFDFTAVGDTVNLGSRLEGVNRHYGTRILLDGPTRAQAASAIRARLIDRVKVAGRKGVVELWELLGVEGEECLAATALDRWERLRTFHDAGDFGALREALSEFLDLVPGDGPALTLLVRAEVMLARGKPADWDGTVALGK